MNKIDYLNDIAILLGVSKKSLETASGIMSNLGDFSLTQEEIGIFVSDLDLSICQIKLKVEELEQTERNK